MRKCVRFWQKHCFMLPQVYFLWSLRVSIWIYCNLTPEVVVKRRLQTFDSRSQTFVFGDYSPGAIWWNMLALEIILSQYSGGLFKFCAVFVASRFLCTFWYYIDSQQKKLGPNSSTMLARIWKKTPRMRSGHIQLRLHRKERITISPADINLVDDN